MANFNIFSSKKTDTRNEAGGRAYTLSPKQQLAQLAATGCFNDTFYASAETQLEQILNIAQKVEPLFIAKTAIYARERGYMKDMPALLLAMLAGRDVALCAQYLIRLLITAKCCVISHNGAQWCHRAQIIRYAPEKIDSTMAAFRQ